MRLLSIHLRRYRIHADVRVEFDPARTLIGGMNESGKSTLAEAIHRALFLKANGNSHQHRVLASYLHGGSPEVELVFEAGGRVHTLTKRFGSNGTVTLASGNDAPLQGDAAQEALHQLLHLELDGSSRSIDGLWAHLWVWQGESTIDPSVGGSHPSLGLVKELGRQGGGAACQSDDDMEVARHFAESCSAIFTANQKPKTGSALGEAEAVLNKARNQLEAANAAVTRLADASHQLAESNRVFAEACKSLTDHAGEKARIEENQSHLSILRKQEEQEKVAFDTAEKLHRSLSDADTRIRQIEAEILQKQAEVAPLEDAVRRQDKEAADARQAHADRDREHRAAEDALRIARLRRDLADARLRCREKTSEQEQLAGREKKISACQEQLARLGTELAALPALQQSGLRGLEQIHSDLRSAQAALEAMATGIELLAADGSVLAGGQPLAVGQPLILTRTTELLIAPGTRLRIQPGGGSSLEAALTRESELREALRRQLDALGLDSIAAAGKVVAQREALENKAAQARAELLALGADTLPRALEAARQDLAAARASVERLTALLPTDALPSDLDLDQAVAALNGAEALELAARQARDEAMDRLNAAETARHQQSTQHGQQAQVITQRQAQLDLLVQQHGAEDERTRAISNSRIQVAQAGNQLAVTTRSIEDLRPDALELAIERNRRATKKDEQQKAQAATRIEVQKALLRLDGSTDPVAEQAAAEARAQTAEDRHQAALREAKAVQLLATLFHDEQQALSARFTAPLVERVRGYLKCLFGSTTQVSLKLEDNEFQGLRVHRPGLDGKELDFADLSMGAREQLAAALRLAMAEILAAAHDGCLPVIFDDAFSFSDADRLVQVQEMLDLAASRGLQIILLSCNPAEFSRLGAEPVRLFRHVLTGVVPAPRPAPEATSDSGTAVNPAQAAQFLEALRAGGGSMGNTSLRTQLGWDDATYAAVKQFLLDGGRIIPGRGRGGSVALMDSAPG